MFKNLLKAIEEAIKIFILCPIKEEGTIKELLRSFLDKKMKVVFSMKGKGYFIQKFKRYNN